jgi:hypothetical protein
MPAKPPSTPKLTDNVTRLNKPALSTPLSGSFPLGPSEIAVRDFVRVIQSMREAGLPWYAPKFAFEDALELARAIEEDRPRDRWVIP